MITKETVVDQITVNENGIVLYREATRIIEDGVELTKKYHRTSLTPGQDLTGQPANVGANAVRVVIVAINGAGGLAALRVAAEQPDVSDVNACVKVEGHDAPPSLL